MRVSVIAVAGGVCLLSVFASADIIHVAQGSSTNGPGTEWGNAYHEIQDAVNVATNGDTVLVSNGVYSTGETVLFGLRNRVALQKPITLKSVNGPEDTSIVGAGPNGDSAIRCVYAMSGAVVSGFTLREGHTLAYTGAEADEAVTGGGALLNGGGVLTNCTIRECSASQMGGGVTCLFGGIVENCMITQCDAELMAGGALCAAGGVVRSTTICSNTATASGGGASVVASGLFDSCVLRDNRAEGLFVPGYGVVGGSGGAFSTAQGGTLRNCVVVDNWATNRGGGVVLSQGGDVENCTIVNNRCEIYGGGLYIHDEDDEGPLSPVVNTIVWGNSAGDGDDNINDTGGLGVYSYCCTTPDPGGVSNVINAPWFADDSGTNFHLWYQSLCVDAGTNLASVVADHDGVSRPRDGDVDDTPRHDIGAFEYDPYVSDIDGDGMSDGAEMRAGTDVTNKLSRLEITRISRAGGDTVLRWSSVSNHTYSIQVSSNLLAHDWGPVASGLPATLPDNVHTVEPEQVRGECYRVTVD